MECNKPINNLHLHSCGLLRTSREEREQGGGIPVQLQVSTEVRRHLWCANSQWQCTAVALLKNTGIELIEGVSGLPAAVKPKLNPACQLSDHIVPAAFAGAHFVISGEFSSTRSLMRCIWDNGGTVHKNPGPSRRITHALVGADGVTMYGQPTGASTKKVKAALKQGAVRVSEGQIWAALRAWETDGDCLLPDAPEARLSVHGWAGGNGNDDGDGDGDGDGDRDGSDGDSNGGGGDSNGDGNPSDEGRAVATAARPATTPSNTAGADAAAAAAPLVDYASLSRRQLQREAKRRGIAANQKSAVLVSLLLQHTAGAGESEAGGGSSGKAAAASKRKWSAGVHQKNVTAEAAASAAVPQQPAKKKQRKRVFRVPPALRDSVTPLLWAVKKGRFEELPDLLSAGQDPEGKAHDLSITPLQELVKAIRQSQPTARAGGATAGADVSSTAAAAVTTADDAPWQAGIALATAGGRTGAHSLLFLAAQKRAPVAVLRQLLALAWLRDTAEERGSNYRAFTARAPALTAALAQRNDAVVELLLQHRRADYSDVFLLQCLTTHAQTAVALNALVAAGVSKAKAGERGRALHCLQDCTFLPRNDRATPVRRLELSRALDTWDDVAVRKLLPRLLGVDPPPPLPQADEVSEWRHGCTPICPGAALPEYMTQLLCHSLRRLPVPSTAAVRCVVALARLGRVCMTQPQVVRLLRVTDRQHVMALRQAGLLPPLPPLALSTAEDGHDDDDHVAVDAAACSQQQQRHTQLQPALLLCPDSPSTAQRFRESLRSSSDAAPSSSTFPPAAPRSSSSSTTTAAPPSTLPTTTSPFFSPPATGAGGKQQAASPSCNRAFALLRAFASDRSRGTPSAATHHTMPTLTASDAPQPPSFAFTFFGGDSNNRNYDDGSRGSSQLQQQQQQQQAARLSVAAEDDCL